MVQKRLIKNPYQNCRAKDPRTCPYHSNFKPLTLGTKITELFERIDKDFPPVVTKELSFDHSFDAFLEDSDSFDAKLSRDERYALHLYSDSYGSRKITYTLINDQAETFYDTGIIQQIKLIDSALAKSNTLKQDLCLFRGMNNIPESWGELSLGQTVEFKNFVSTSLNPIVALDFANDESPVLFEIKSSSGAPIRYHFGEFEYLIPRDEKYRVLDIEENVRCVTKSSVVSKRKNIPGVTVIKLEQVK